MITVPTEIVISKTTTPLSATTVTHAGTCNTVVSAISVESLAFIRGEECDFSVILICPAFALAETVVFAMLFVFFVIANNVVVTGFVSFLGKNVINSVFSSPKFVMLTRRGFLIKKSCRARWASTDL